MAKKVDLYSVYKPNDISVTDAFASKKEAEAMISHYKLAVGNHYTIDKLNKYKISNYSYSTLDAVCRIFSINIIKKRVDWLWDEDEPSREYSDKFMVEITIDQYINHGVLNEQYITFYLTKDMNVIKEHSTDEKEMMMKTINDLKKQLETISKEFSNFKIKVGEEMSNMKESAWKDKKRNEIETEMKIMEGNNTHHTWSSVDIECIHGSVPFGVYKKSSRYAYLEKELKNYR